MAQLLYTVISLNRNYHDKWGHGYVYKAQVVLPMFLSEKIHFHPHPCLIPSCLLCPSLLQINAQASLPSDRPGPGPGERQIEI